MTELLPSLQAEEIRAGLVDYLTTTFALADAEPRQALADFLQDPVDGIFKGPYVRLRLPFRPAAPGWEDALDWTPPFVPYRHQAAAYRRLTSKDLGPDKPRPLPTIVTTGTGSGKTEAFLHPILDHVLRARAEGHPGVKALILYPMNALADDQAGRLTRLITEDPALAGVRAGLYTGDTDGGRTMVTPEGLITHRKILREDPPDILLTNYKMLDMLLLRHDDQRIWESSARTLQYLVLDEFHTYDGAQGTDVAMLLRRLGLALRHHLPEDHPRAADFAVRPLGPVTPVATSATLGDGSDPEAMLSFAGDVFGESFGRDAAVTESRIDVMEFADAARARAFDSGMAPRRLRNALADDLDTLARLGKHGRGDTERLTRAVAATLYNVAELDETASPSDLLRAHPDVRVLIERADQARHADELADEIFPPSVGEDRDLRRAALGAVLAALSHVRLGDRGEATVEVTQWVREVSRVDRALSAVTSFHWSDDGGLIGTPEGPQAPTLPATYCRACGRSGWAALLAPTGADLAGSDATIRRDHLLNNPRVRTLLHAPGEDLLVAERAAAGEPNPQAAAPRLGWLDVEGRRILSRRPAEDDEGYLEGRILPVLWHAGDSAEAQEANTNDECPSCGKRDQIRFLGSAIATLLSVGLTTLFGDAHLDSREKRALIFTDSVQDAAHRAGFVDHRSHAMSLRAALRTCLDRSRSLTDWVERALAAADGDTVEAAFARYRLVPATLTTHAAFRGYWQPGATAATRRAARGAVARRLLFDAALEVGLQTSFGRTLEATGSIGVHVDAGSTAAMVAAARAALTADGTLTLPVEYAAPTDAALVRWVRGTVEHLRTEGAIEHEWLTRYVKDDGARIWIWGKRPRNQGAPAFPRGRSAPAFAVTGVTPGDRSAFVAAGSAKSWYAQWAVKTLHVSPPHGASVAVRLLARLAADGVLTQHVTNAGGRAYGIPTDRIIATPLSEADIAHHTTLLVCATCRTSVPVCPEVADQLDHGPCPVVRCPGRLGATAREPQSFYRSLFAAARMRRVDAREHTSLLVADERRAIEAGFKRARQEPGDPNVLVATPTLELGIDIGDLTTVVLSSLPDAVAKYLQRVGRAGRLTGSSLALAYLAGRGDQLPRLGDPTSMINGAVRPPATYLDAEEILRRQFLASVIDDLVRRTGIAPQWSGEALKLAEPGTFLGEVIDHVRRRGPQLLDSFVATMPDAKTPGLASLRAWALPGDRDGASQGPVDPDAPSAPRLEATLYRAAQEHQGEIERAVRQRKEIAAAYPELKARAALPAASEDDKAAQRSAAAGLRLLDFILDRLRHSYWVSGLEERGLLPNYSLIDDSVELDAQVSWIDPESGDFEAESWVIERGSSRALSELAPGASFYARRLQMRVDGIEIGGQDAEIRTWVACPTCGYAVDLGVTGTGSPHVCPRCGDADIHDVGNRFDAVRMRRVFSDTRRDDAAITDSDDQRQRTTYEIVPAVDFDPARRERIWTLPASGFGVASYRGLELRWFNVGRDLGRATRSMAGRQVIAAGFRICDTCGKLDRHGGANTRREHRPWCSRRDDPTEHTRTVALTRTLRTQGVALVLPPSVTSDLHSVPSLSAAVLLGLRETLGGAPTHLNIELVPHPLPGATGAARPALLVHDIVPGGTGYLTELADPARLWTVLVKAARVLASCPCREEGRASCHRCLLPFTRRPATVYRSVASKALETLLGLGEDVTVDDLDPAVPVWQTEEGAITTGAGESTLEQLFRAAFTDAVGAFATVSEKPGPTGPVVTVTGVGDHVWTLTPQVLVGPTRPDFVLRTSGQRPIAIYTDGAAFHATTRSNRLLDDAVKRAGLRAMGYRVLGISQDDLLAPSDPPWLNPGLIDLLMRLPAGTSGSGISRQAVQEQRAGPLALLSGVLQAPRDDSRRALADATGLLLAPTSVVLPADGIDDLATAAAGWVTRPPVAAPSPGDTVRVHRQPHLVLATRFTGSWPAEMALILDDRPQALDEPDFLDTWRTFLRLSNLLAFSDTPCAIDTVCGVLKRPAETDEADRSPAVPPVASRAAAGSAAQPAAGPLQNAALTTAWPNVDLASFPADVITVATHLAARDVPPAEDGGEIDGIIVDLAWPAERVGVLGLDAPDEDAEELRAAGWRVYRSDAAPEEIAAAVRRGQE